WAYRLCPKLYNALEVLRPTVGGLRQSSPARFRRLVLSYYARHARDLPWRRTRDPYAVLVSEVMLQQTQVSRVVPAYRSFLARPRGAGPRRRAAPATQRRSLASRAHGPRRDDLRLAVPPVHGLSSRHDLPRPRRGRGYPARDDASAARVRDERPAAARSHHR